MYLVTGGLGFIGNELVRQLKEEVDVAILDNRNRVAPRIEDLASVPVHEVDLTNHARVRTLIGDLKPEVVVHLAAIHFIPECNGDPERTLRINVEATQGLLRACSDLGVKHLLVASSGAVYADSPEPLTESSLVEPVDIYGLSKWFSEKLCGWHAQQRGLKITLLRLFNNYGPRETNPHIIPEIIQQLHQGDTLRLGNIKPRRDYIHTKDTAKAIRLLANRRPESITTVNIASGYHASVGELVEMTGELLGREIQVKTDPARFRKADKLIQVADIQLLETLTGWHPEIDLRLGLTDLLRFEGLLK
jgi:UDP-glucose 4-epimerase